MIVDAGQQLALAPVSQMDLADEVQLPTTASVFPVANAVLALVPLLLRTDQAVPYQDPVHRRPGRSDLHTS